MKNTNNIPIVAIVSYSQLSLLEKFKSHDGRMLVLSETFTPNRKNLYMIM